VTYVGRFAPSPTGPLHFGSLVAAVASWLDARAQGGEWLVRIEDVDEPRTVPGAADEILRALEAFGLSWDGPVVRQSERAGRYRAALESLASRGLVYRCRCSRREIADSALRGIDAMIYPGTCRALGLGAETDGADRLRVPEGIVEFTDRVMGRVAQDVQREIGDFVLRRRDGLFAYQLAVVVDDADQGITDVVRGADLLLSTPRQIVLQRSLGLPRPRYLHVPVATTQAGEKLSKQTGAAPVDARHASGLLGEALAFLGQPAPESGTPATMLRAALARWSPAQIPCRSAAAVTFRDGNSDSPGV
jgi:glutamyl-Q tRNA(Asp) synthetase